MKNKAIFITATNTNIGKTYTALLLLEEFAKRGYKVGAFKPIETGVEDIPKDGLKLLKKSKQLNPDFYSIGIEDVTPVTFKLPAAPFVAKKNNFIDFEKISKAFEKISSICDIVIIEGAGGILVPIDENFFMIDFIDFFNATPLLITHDKLGCINDTLLSINIFQQKKIPFVWCINKRDNSENFKIITLSYYQYKFKNIYFLESNIETIADKLLIT